MSEALAEEIELEEEASRTVETEQERLDRQGIYGEIKRELVKRGIPAHEIAFIHDFKTPAEKARAFADANAGKIRVMIASTEKAGAGTNMQERLCALHHLDAPWRPSDVEQREGRILRLSIHRLNGNFVTLCFHFDIAILLCFQLCWRPEQRVIFCITEHQFIMPRATFL